MLLTVSNAGVNFPLPTAGMDYYGFPLSLTPQQTAARQRNEASEAQLVNKWSRHAKKGMLPGDDSLKKLVRKVQPHSLMLINWSPSVGRQQED